MSKALSQAIQRRTYSPMLFLAKGKIWMRTKDEKDRSVALLHLFGNRRIPGFLPCAHELTDYSSWVWLGHTPIVRRIYLREYIA